MNLYLCSQDSKDDYDTYDSFICAASDEREARLTSPEHNYSFDQSRHVWCVSPDLVTVKLIGVADKSIEKGVVCASFNAG